MLMLVNMFCCIQCHKILTNSCGLFGLVSLDSHSIPLIHSPLSLKKFLHKQSHDNNKNITKSNNLENLHISH